MDMATAMGSGWKFIEKEYHPIRKQGKNDGQTKK